MIEIQLLSQNTQIDIKKQRVIKRLKSDQS